MKHAVDGERVLEVSSLLGIVAAFGVMVPAFFVPDLALLAVPAFVLLIVSLLLGTR